MQIARRVYKNTFIGRMANFNYKSQNLNDIHHQAINKGKNIYYTISRHNKKRC